MKDSLVPILTLVALLLAFVLLYVRTARFEVYLKELKGLKGLIEKIRSLNEAVEKVQTTALEEHLFELNQKTGRILEILETRDQEVRAEAKETLQSLLESFLYGMGYERVKLLGELRDVSGPGPFEVQVECVKGDVVHKGAVILQGGRVVECRLRPAYEVFP